MRFTTKDPVKVDIPQKVTVVESSSSYVHVCVDGYTVGTFIPTATPRGLFRVESVSGTNVDIEVVDQRGVVVYTSKR